MPPTAKVQSPAVLVGLSVVTLGLYLPVWYYRVNREMRDLGRARGDIVLAMSRPAHSAWALIAGGVVVVPTIVSVIGTTDRLRRCERLFACGAGAGTTVVALVSAAMATGSRTRSSIESHNSSSAPGAKANASDRRDGRPARRALHRSAPPFPVGRRAASALGSQPGDGRDVTASGPSPPPMGV